MSNPLKVMVVTGEFRERAVPPTGLPDAAGIKRHIGLDLRARTPLPFYAPYDGKVISRDETGMIILETEMKDKWVRFLHLSKITKKTGSFKQGDLLGYTGSTGTTQAHLHVDVRKKGTAYNASLNNYEDPLPWFTKYDKKVKMITESQSEVLYRMYCGSGITPTGRKNIGKKTWEQERKRLQGSKTYKAEVERVKKGGSPGNHLPSKIRAVYKHK